jgi:hypothetical protein
MRPRNQTARDQLLATLGRQPAAGAAGLAARLDVSLATLHRLLQEVQPQVLATGRARRTRYALRRPLRGDLSELPVYEVDAAGRAELLGPLALVAPQGTWMDLSGSRWPVPDESRDGWWGGLPYPLYDMRPQGYMGRQLARASHRELGVSADLQAWSDDDVLHVLSRLGSDVSGNLILGNLAYERWLSGKLAPPAPLAEPQLGPAYAALAEEAIATGVAGSSAAGEFPKFAAQRQLAGSGTPHVLVKFSGADRSAAVRRWSDLLVCEHLALECIAEGLPGQPSAKSRVVQHAGRTFLELERFDRHGLFGRSALIGLETVNAAFIGDASTDWTRLAERLVAAGLLGEDDAQRIRRLWWFGRLIGNTDMHTGNLSFMPVEGRFALAPAYDMLPMLYAPLPGGELPAREFAPPLPLPPQRPEWSVACSAALRFWQLASKDNRLSIAFRASCKANGQQLQRLAEHA